MIDLNTERVMPLSRTRDFIPSEPSPVTILNWAHRGVMQADGTCVKLELVHIGGHHSTSLEAVARFIEACNADNLSTLNWRKERIVSMSKAYLLGAIKIPPSTARNWVMLGVQDPNGKRVFLETVKIGGMRYTSVEALNRFYCESNKEK